METAAKLIQSKITNDAWSWERIQKVFSEKNARRTDAKRMYRVPTKVSIETVADQLVWNYRFWQRQAREIPVTSAE